MPDQNDPRSPTSKPTSTLDAPPARRRALTYAFIGAAADHRRGGAGGAGPQPAGRHVAPPPCRSLRHGLAPLRRPARAWRPGGHASSWCSPSTPRAR